MNAPVKSILAVGVAFAAGVAVTAVYVGDPSGTAGTRLGMMGGSPETTAPGQPPGVAARGPASRVSESATAAKGATASAEAWVDPVKQRTAAAAATPPRPPLVFHMDRERAEAGATHPEEAAMTPPRRPKASELLAKSAGQRDPDAASAPEDRIAAARPSGAAPSRKTPAASRHFAGSPRRPSGNRVAASEVEPDDVRVAVERQARRAPFARRDFAGWPPDPYALRNPDGLDRYERDVADRAPVSRRRVTSAESGGVLRWLEEP